MSHKVGYGFNPNDEELLYYLKLKVLGVDVDDTIAEVDILKHEPWDLPEFSVTNSNGPWYFSYKPEYKSSNGKQIKRTTSTGYWKVTGPDRKVWTRDTKEQIGIKKILTYYTGHFASGKKTNWVIHEYHLTSPDIPDKGAYVVCFLKEKADKKADNSTPEEGESSRQGTFDYGNISEITCPEVRKSLPSG